jgi:hypothetical protein
MRTRAAGKKPKPVVETFVFERPEFVSLSCQVATASLTTLGDAAFRRNATRETHAMRSQ